MAEIRCALQIATLEGWKDFALPVDHASVTLEGLDIRLRRLEKASGVQPPAPMLQETWASLTYRLSRLDRKAGPRVVLDKRTHAEHLPTGEAAEDDGDDDDLKKGASTTTTAAGAEPAALASLKSMVAKLRPDASAAWPAGPDAALRAVAQQLCHVGGRNGYKPAMLDLDIGNLYSFAAELSIELENRPFPPQMMRPPGMGMHPPPPPGGWRGPPPPPPQMGGAVRPGKRSACCGCCSCNCHGGGRDGKGGKGGGRPGFFRTASSVSSSGSSVKKGGRLRRVFGFGWLKGLWCFGKKSGYESDSDTDSTVSSTIVDD